MIVTRSNFDAVLASLCAQSPLALDTETTGLSPYQGDEFFSVILYDGEQAYYFNFNDGPDIPEEAKLEAPEYREKLGAFLASSPGRLFYLHNARFDLAILANAGWHVEGHIHDTMAVARLLDSTLLPSQFSLDEVASKALGVSKLDTVKEWCLKNKAFKEVKAEGKKSKKKDLLFSLAPFDLIVPYAERDAEITWKLGEWQREELAAMHERMKAARVPATVTAVYENELALTRTVYEMEARGVLVDRDFCQRAIADCSRRQETALESIEPLAGEPFKASPLFYQRAFAGERERWVYGAMTATGKVNPSFDSDVLETFESPVARHILDWRKAKSDADYYHGFLHGADNSGVLHASFNQHGAATGRFSSSNPNLQNLTKDEDEGLEREFVVRRAVIPRPGMVFHMLDYNQMEYRLMLDYAARFAADDDGVLALITKVLRGLDVHQATADVAGIDRSSAKTTNFAVLYGSGLKSLSERLEVSQSRAGEIRGSIFRAAPEIDTFIRKCTKSAELRGYVVNWLGRFCGFPDANFAYRAPNHVIQGGCADIFKLAMNQIRAALAQGGWRTQLVLVIHDEAVLEGPPEEAAIVIPRVKKIMETAYPHRFLPLTCGVDHSFKSLADKVEGIATYAECARRA